MTDRELEALRVEHEAAAEKATQILEAHFYDLGECSIAEVLNAECLRFDALDAELARVKAEARPWTDDQRSEISAVVRDIIARQEKRGTVGALNKTEVSILKTLMEIVDG